MITVKMITLATLGSPASGRPEIKSVPDLLNVMRDRFGFTETREFTEQTVFQFLNSMRVGELLDCIEILRQAEESR